MDADKPGHGKPPKATQFKPGQSGNPRGRPKGVRNLRSDLANVLEKRVRIREDGQQHRVSGQRAMLLKLFEKALSGDIRAANQLFGMLMKLDADDPPEKEPENVTERDEAIIAEFLRRNIPSNNEVPDS
jgi:Family of unknown function (DUF5681)